MPITSNGVRASQYRDSNGNLIIRSSDGTVTVGEDTDGSYDLTGAGGGSSTSISDSDGDTAVKTEESSDEDVVRIDAGNSGTPVEVARAQLDGSGNNQFILPSNSASEPPILAFSGETGTGIRDNGSGSFQIVVFGGTILTATSNTANFVVAIDADSGSFGHVEVGGVNSADNNAIALNNTSVSSTPPSWKSSQVFAKDVSSSSELHGHDEAGNEVQLTPHPAGAGILERHSDDPVIPWAYRAQQNMAGQVVTADMLGLFRVVEELYAAVKALGGTVSSRIESIMSEGLIQTESFTPAEDWTNAQKRQNANYEAARLQQAVEQADNVEISASEALEQVTETRRRETGNKVNVTRYRIADDGTVEPYTLEQDETTEQQVTVWRRKSGVRFDETTGKFYRRPTEDEVTPVGEPRQAKEPPQYLKDRGVVLDNNRL